MLNDTAAFNAALQLQDAVALFPSLVAENQRSGSFFFGALDMTRAGLCGHSMGGGNAIRALAQNPGYKAGFCFAPWDGRLGGQGVSWAPVAAGVQVPLAMLHGQGDSVLDWQQTSLLFFNAATNFSGVKSLVVLDGHVTHGNLVRIVPSPSATDLAAFSRGMSMVAGWFRRHLRDDVTGMEQVVGNLVRNGPLFSLIATNYRSAELWRFGEPSIGTTLQFGLGNEPGFGWIYLSPATASISLPFGSLGLDPTLAVELGGGQLPGARLLSSSLSIPNDQSLIGTPYWLQAVTASNGSLGLSNVVPFLVQ